jgi:hypothetical protein
MAGVGGPLGTGGMATKLGAAKKACASGIATVIADGRRPGVLAAVLAGAGDVGTFFRPVADRLAARKQWIAYTLKTGGALVVDDGARRAIVEQGRSLLASGIREVRGSFGVGACVQCLDLAGHELARGLVSYSAAELDKIKGRHSREIESTLGYKMSDEVIHRDDLVRLARPDAAGRRLAARRAGRARKESIVSSLEQDVVDLCRAARAAAPALAARLDRREERGARRRRRRSAPHRRAARRQRAATSRPRARPAWRRRSSTA